MSIPENDPQAGSPSVEPEANSQDLNRLVNILFAAMILSSFTLTAYLGLQMKRASEEETAAKSQSVELAQAVRQQDASIQATYEKLSEFAHKHPEFQKDVLNKYKLSVTPPAK